MEPIGMPTKKDEHEHVYPCSGCGKPADQSVTWLQRGGEWYKYVHYIEKPCDCRNKKNA